MKFKYYPHIKNKKVLSEIKELLALCDNEFVPPLSARSSTTQADLSSKGNISADVSDYFNEISKQAAIVAVENGTVIGFISFKQQYICEHITEEYHPNLYVTTVIVSPKHRNRSIAGKMYDTLIKRFPFHYIFTRTWSTNLSHIRILLSRRFHEHCVLSNDRGKNIDTNYYRRDPQKIRFTQYLNQYHLNGNFLFALLLLVVTIAFVLAWFFIDNNMLHELSLAVATSLMASFLCLISDTFLKLRNSKNDKYINTLKGYGIANLQFNKNELLESIIPLCRKEIWISGYRLVMTSKPTFRHALATACKRSKNLNVKLLATPPWTDAYKLVYGEEDVSLNYIKVIKELAEYTQIYGVTFEVAFSLKPLFSDTYKIDNRIVTGPYLHCADKYNTRITAKDFFSFDITSADSELYKIFYNDYSTLWSEAYATLDIKLFLEKAKDVADFEKLSAEERLSFIQECCIIKN